jgi:hypothetical protein
MGLQLVYCVGASVPVSLEPVWKLCLTSQPCPTSSSVT